MIYIKDDPLAVLTRTFTAAKQDILVVSVLAGFSLGAPDNLFDEDHLWELASEALDRSQVLDQGMPKPGGEVLIAGKCFAPKNKTVSAEQASFRVGAVRKSVYIFGPRRWETPLYLVKVISKPEPFTQMDITWNNALGGPDFDRNPQGKGLSEVISPEGDKYVPLPNIEDPGHLISSSSDKPDPAGFGPLGLDWPSRLRRLGTFDEKWLEESWPGFPDDFDFSYFNLAPKDQRMDGYFRGNEQIELTAMHPEQAVLHSELPGLRARVFAELKTAEGDVFKEIKTRLDTIWLFPHQDMGLCIWRGTMPVNDDEAEEVDHLLAFREKLTEEPKPASHYQALMEEPPEEEEMETADKEEDETEEPEPPVAPVEEPEQPDPETDNKALAAALAPIQKAVKEAEAELDAHLRGLGIDPDQTPVKPVLKEAASSLEPEYSELPEHLGPEEMIKHVTAQREAAEKQLFDHLAKLGIDPDAEPSDLSLTEPSLDEVVGALKQLPGDHSELIGMIMGLEKDLKQSRDNIAGIQKEIDASTPEVEEPPLPEEPETPSEREEEPDALTRDDVLSGYEKGLSFAGKDLSGLDLSGCKLPGIDLCGAVLEETNLSGTDLSGAKLNKAILTGSELTGARLALADLSGASAGMVKLAEADLKEAKLHFVDFKEADLNRADMRNADAMEADFSGALLTGANCRELKGRGADFTSADLSEAECHEADFFQADLSESKLNHADFTRADMSETALADANGEGCVFNEANLGMAKADGQTILNNAQFREADLSGSYWEDVDFSSADFKGAILNGAAFTRCTLNKAGLYRSQAKRTDFSKSNLDGADMRFINLFDGSLRKTRITGADLRGSNLSGVDLYKSIQGDTLFEGANLNRTILALWRKK